MFGGSAPPSQRQLYLCHNFCELGATPAADAFRDIHDWLAENPNEVIILDIEDHVSGQDAVRELEKSGLADLAYRWTPGTPMPTLGHMIETKHNVLVMAENRGGVTPWYLDAYKSVLQETPYRFDSPADLSCGEKRGLDTNPLFLLNHWIENDIPDPKVAGDMNAAAFLEAPRRPARSNATTSRTSWPSTSTPRVTSSRRWPT